MASVNVLIAINGTHDNVIMPMAAGEYDRLFAGSHVDRIYRASFMPFKKYIRGPTAIGGGVSEALASAVEFLWQVQKAQPGDMLQVHLIGFSRGAAMCLELANWLSAPSTLAVFNPFKTDLTAAAYMTRLDRGSIKVRALGMFDAVDMSFYMECEPIHPRVERSVQIRRAGWRSREGWTNVGDTSAAGTPPGAAREHWPLIGTHGAMGGQPVNGDIPIPLARELLTALGSVKLPRNLPNWSLATVRWRQLKRAGSLAKAKSEQQRLPKPPYNAQQTAIDLVDFHELLRSYANIDYMMNPAGISAVSANGDLFGFPGLFWIFQDIRICMGIIERFAALDRKASADALTLMRKGLGPAFPATL